MCNIKYKLSVLLFFIVSMTAQGQYIIKQADTEAALYNYAKAIPLYQKAYNKKQTTAAARGLADSYLHLNDYTNAQTWYEKLVAMPDHTADDEIYYAKTLIGNGKYTTASTILDAYIAKKPEDQKAVILRVGCDSAIRWLATPAPTGDFENLQLLNSEWSDWSTGFYNDKIIFASDRPYDSVRPNSIFSTSNIKKKYYSWTGNSYLHLYEGNAADSNSAKLLARTINGDYHSANASYTADGRKMYYAVTDLQKKPHTFAGKEPSYTLHVEIMEETYDTATGKWKKTLFPYNGIFNYAVGDPHISPDGKILYFAADYADKGMGGTDIYYSVHDSSGQWQAPVNMGPEINTIGNERTPVFDKRGMFYFATDGRPGFGGLDIFRAVKEREHWVVKNMGTPVNSAQDDFAPSAQNNTLYFSSNRPGGKGSDDLYRFTPPRFLFFNLDGTITDKETTLPLKAAEVVLVRKENGAPKKALTDTAGNYHFKLDSLSSYEISVSKAGYSSADGLMVTTMGLTESSDLRQDAVLEAPEPTVAKTPTPTTGFGIDTSSTQTTFRLKNVYFDLDKWDIKPKSVPELTNLVNVLNEHPDWKVELASHTDSRAGDAYNMRLSQKRAESVVAWLISRGIAKDRLVPKGYGETRLTNNCPNGVKCSEEEHQANRRTEFTILNR